jgi:hypothetical protein
MTLEGKIQTITDEIAAKYAIHAMASVNSYHYGTNRITFPIDKLGWRLVDMNGRPTTTSSKEHSFTGLAFDIYEKDDTGAVIFAFRGTNNYKDYLWGNFSIPPFNLQYEQAKDDFGRYLEKSRKTKEDIVVTGHSLGGGLSLCISVHYGIDAITFNPSPRVFDGFGKKHKEATRIAVYEKGEVLDLARKLWRKDNEVIPRENLYQCNYIRSINIVRQHKSDELALGLLKQAARVDASLNGVLDALPPDKRGWVGLA